MRIETNSAIDPRDSTRTGVRITVADTGCGIQTDHIERIFEPFFTTKKDTGTGLGLWVSRELVEKHGGSLRVRSSTANERSGTVFSIFLPAQGKPSQADHDALGEPDTIAQTKATLPNGYSTN